MGSLKSLAFLALLISLSFTVFADTSSDATNAKDEVKPSEATDVIEPQQLGGEAVEAVEPQQRWGGGCRYGCCGPWRFGRCGYCCRSPQAETEVVEPQQSWGGGGGGGGHGGGCRYGCCGHWHYGRCSYCCRRTQAEVEVVKPQDENKKEEAKP